MDNIAKLITEKGVTKYKLSKAIHVNWRTVHNWVNEKCKPNEKNLIQLKQFYEGISK